MLLLKAKGQVHDPSVGMKRLWQIVSTELSAADSL